MVSIEVTTKCNLKCINCFAHSCKTIYSDIDYEDAVTILNEGRELGYTLMSITGGEPLLWSRTLDLMEYGKSIGYSEFLLNSNGHLFSNEICSSLVKLGEGLNISCTVNGFQAKHDAVRGNGSYVKALDGIEKALSYGLNILVYSVVDRENLYDIPQFTEFLMNKFKKIKSLVFIQLRGIDDDYYKVKGLKLDPSQLIKMVRIIGYLALAGYPVMILENSLSTVVSGILGLKWLSDSPEISRNGKIVVLHNGVITDNHSSLVNLGSYEYGRLKKVVSSTKYKELTTGESELCLGCEYLSLCRKSGKLRPSDSFHNVGDDSVFYCKKVLGLLV